MYFVISKLSSLGNGWSPSLKQTRIPFSQGCFVPSLIEIGPVVLEKKIFKFRQCIFAISWLSPLEKGMALYLNQLEFPSPKDALCQVWLKLAQWFWKGRFLNFINVFSPFRYYFPSEKGMALHLYKLESPSPKDALC